MSVIIEANYSKKIGLPGYSSHQYMLTLRAELTDLTQVSAESQRLHSLLQASVDRELQQPGWLPLGIGHAPANGGHGPPPTNGHGHPNGNGHSHPRNGNGHGQLTNGSHEPWNCTPKQQDLIMKIVDDHRLDKTEVERLAMDRFGKGVRQLNKLDASGFIEELFEKYPRPRTNGNGNGHQPQRANYAVR